MGQIKYWMWLACLTRLRPKAKLLALDFFGSVEELFFASAGELRAVEGLRETDFAYLCDKSMDSAMGAMDICAREEIQLIAWGDSAYPRRLSQIYDPPAVLFVKGRMPVEETDCAVCIAGTRGCTPYGYKMAERLGFELGRGGALVVSGLAEGIDSAGALGCLRAGGKCLGVLGTPIDQIYPKSNAALFRDVCMEGALISEYPPGTVYARNHFPARNRILSGLSLGVVIVEAPEKSGALITAEFASEQGRDVFAVPGNADAPACAGSNALLRDCAKLTLDGWDILGEYQGLFPHKIRRPDGNSFSPPPVRSTEKTATPPKDIDNKSDLEYIGLKDQLEGLTSKQLKIISAMEGECYADSIIVKTSLSAAEVMSELTMLQIMGFVTPTGFDKYKLNIKTKRG
ncbi:MAG: DNA-processing protein DprA [Candidatus Heteroscillospira sp.]|jgi:DNA processing protein